MRKPATLYIATDAHGITRISAEKDIHLAEARWRRTSAVCIYRSYGNMWFGSCRMSRAARKKYYDMKLNAFDGQRLSVNQAAKKFAEVLARHEELRSCLPCAPQPEDVLTGENEEGGLIVCHKGIYAMCTRLYHAIPGRDRARKNNMLVFWRDGEKYFTHCNFNCGGPKGELIAKIVDKIDEVANER